MTFASQGRPKPDEAPPWSFRYIDLIREEDLFAVLKRQNEECRYLFSSFNEERSLHRYAPGKWTIRDIVGHVSDAERTFAYRALWFARGFNDALPDFDQEIAAQAAEPERLSWKDIVDEFDRVRLSTISLFANMPLAGWRREGIASGHRFTVRALAYLIPGHAAHHLNVLRDKYR